jgi:teichoic acid glycerol-phosphate primase
MIKAAGLIYGSDLHYLDHLAVVCRLMEIPLFTTEDEITRLAHAYYPGLKVVQRTRLEIAHDVIKEFDVIFSCLPEALFDQIFFLAQQLLQKPIYNFWVPHGNSDKGYHAPFMEGLRRQEVALLYGEKMVDFLRKRGSFDQLKSYVIIGNFRYLFYQREKAFYDALLAQKLLKKIPEGNKILLYAPTWVDSENSSSFFDAAPVLIRQLPDHYTLIIKPHPHLFLDHRTEQILGECKNKKNLLILRDFSPIYPLLQLSDIYIGDMSSIGYDFLAFQRPMFFLNQTNRDAQRDPGLYLYRCGIEIKRAHYSEIYTIIDTHLPTDAAFAHIRKELLRYTFGEEKSWEELHHEIEAVIRVLSKN